MADYGVYFQITSNLGADLIFISADQLDHARFDGNNPKALPSDGRPHQVHLNDPDSGAGAGGRVTYMAIVNGAPRFYSWFGDCPVWSSNNTVRGPGISAWNKGGHPLTVTVAIDANTPGWTPVSPCA